MSVLDQFPSDMKVMTEPTPYKGLKANDDAVSRGYEYYLVKSYNMDKLNKNILGLMQTLAKYGEALKNSGKFATTITEMQATIKDLRNLANDKAEKLIKLVSEDLEVDKSQQDQLNKIREQLKQLGNGTVQNTQLLKEMKDLSNQHGKILKILDVLQQDLKNHYIGDEKWEEQLVKEMKEYKNTLAKIRKEIKAGTKARLDSSETSKIVDLLQRGINKKIEELQRLIEKCCAQKGVPIDDSVKIQMSNFGNSVNKLNNEIRDLKSEISDINVDNINKLLNRILSFLQTMTSKPVESAPIDVPKFEVKTETDTKVTIPENGSLGGDDRIEKIPDKVGALDLDEGFDSDKLRSTKYTPGQQTKVWSESERLYGDTSADILVLPSKTMLALKKVAPDLFTLLQQKSMKKKPTTYDDMVRMIEETKANFGKGTEAIFKTPKNDSKLQPTMKLIIPKTFLDLSEEKIMLSLLDAYNNMYSRTVSSNYVNGFDNGDYPLDLTDVKFGSKLSYLSNQKLDLSTAHIIRKHVIDNLLFVQSMMNNERVHKFDWDITLTVLCHPMFQQFISLSQNNSAEMKEFITKCRAIDPKTVDELRCQRAGMLVECLCYLTRTSKYIFTGLPELIEYYKEAKQKVALVRNVSLATLRQKYKLNYYCRLGPYYDDRSKDEIKFNKKEFDEYYQVNSNLLIDAQFNKKAIAAANLAKELDYTNLLSKIRTGTRSFTFDSSNVLNVKTVTDNYLEAAVWLNAIHTGMRRLNFITNGNVAQMYMDVYKHSLKQSAK